MGVFTVIASIHTYATPATHTFDRFRALLRRLMALFRKHRALLRRYGGVYCDSVHPHLCDTSHTSPQKRPTFPKKSSIYPPKSPESVNRCGWTPATHTLYKIRALLRIYRTLFPKCRSLLRRYGVLLRRYRVDGLEMIAPIRFYWLFCGDAGHFWGDIGLFHGDIWSFTLRW